MQKAAGEVMKTYLRHRSQNVIDVKELIALEYLDFEGKYKNYVEKHDFCELCYVLRGDIKLSLDGKEISLTRHELVFIEPNTEHSYFSELGNESRAFVICFESPSQAARPLAGIKFHLDEGERLSVRRIIDEAKDTFRTNEKDQLELTDEPSFGGQQMIILEIQRLLITLLRRMSNEQNSGVVFLRGESFYPDLVEIIKRYLSKNVSKRITLNDICEKFNYSRSFICKIFKEQTGESLITYFNELKIEEAKRLLLESELSVSAISERLSFSEPKYFCQTFKAHIGKTPLEYRRKSSKDRQ